MSAAEPAATPSASDAVKPASAGGPAGAKTLLEEGAALTPRFNADGLITAVTCDAATRDVLMVAHMNAEALRRTLETGDAWYYSRSRQALWRKGETSGHTQKVTAIFTDCDQDAVLLLVEQHGPACHTGRRSCFYRRIVAGPDGQPMLEMKASGP